MVNILSKIQGYLKIVAVSCSPEIFCVSLVVKVMNRFSQQFDKAHNFSTWKLVSCFLLGLKIKDCHSLFFQHRHSKFSIYYIVFCCGKRVDYGYKGPYGY